MSLVDFVIMLGYIPVGFESVTVFGPSLITFAGYFLLLPFCR